MQKETFAEANKILKEIEMYKKLKIELEKYLDYIHIVIQFDEEKSFLLPNDMVCFMDAKCSEQIKELERKFEGL